jgi:hypothetical protein
VAVLFAAAVLLSACGMRTREQAPVNLAGFPPGYRDGYADGCHSATHLLERQDHKRFAQDRQYAAGWKDGLDVCRRKRK